MGSPTIFNGPFTKTLTDNIKLREDKHLRAADTDDPTITAKDSPAGSLYLQSGSNKIYKKESDGNDTFWKDIEASSEQILLLKADWYDIASGSTGNNSVFDGGGTLQGASALSSAAASIINGSKVFQLTLNATGGNSDDDYWNLGTFDIPQGYRNSMITMRMRYRYDGASGEIAWRVKDTTNGDILSIDSDTFDAYDETNNSAKEFQMIFFRPADCQQIEFGPQVLTHATGSEVLEFSDIQVLGIPEAFIPYQQHQRMQQEAAQNTFVSLANTGLGFPTAGWTDTGPQLVSRRVGASSRTEFTANVDCFVTININVQVVNANTSLLIFNSSGTLVWSAGIVSNSSAYNETTLVDWFLAAGDYLYIRNNSGNFRNTTNTCYMTLTARNAVETKVRVGDQANSSQVRLHTGNGHGSTNTRIRRFTTTVDNIGSDIIYADSATDGASFTIQTDGIYHISYSDGATAASNRQHGLSLNSAQLTTDISSITAADRLAMEFNQSGSTAPVGTVSWTGRLQAGDVIRPHTDSFASATATAQFTISKIGGGQVLPVNTVAYLSEQQTANTFGGTFTSGADQTRTLNTVEGDASFVSLSSNQFTLGPGKYQIEAEAPAYQVNGHKAWIRNITDSTNDIIGRSCYTGTGDVTNDYCHVSGTLDITSSKTYELRHRCQTTKATEGYGTASNVGGLPEVYSKVKITRIG